MKRILLIPDAYFGSYSGSIVTRVIKKILVELGHEVAIFSTDINEDFTEADGTTLFPRKLYGLRYTFTVRNHSDNFDIVLNNFNPDYIFTVGSITNKNLIYFKKAAKNGVKIVSMIFMQDFFCMKIYSYRLDRPCTLCLDNGFFESVRHRCIIESPLDYLRNLNGINIRKMLKDIMPSFHAVIGSSDYQLNLYEKFGISRDTCYKIPLFFDTGRVRDFQPEISNYFLCIAQNREEKGFQFIKPILKHCTNDIKIILIYPDSLSVQQSISVYGFQEFIDKGMLEVKCCLSGDDEFPKLIGNSRGVIIPSIWPTTTEFVLLEALGYNKPVFCFDLGVHSELIESGKNGFLAPIGDHKFLADQLIMLNQDNEAYLRISLEAGDLYRKLTNWDNWKEALLNIL